MTTNIKHGHFRVGTIPTPRRETERDVAIGINLAKRRFLDADQICRLVEPSKGGDHTETKRRLTKLFRNGFVAKPEQKEYWVRAGRNFHVYGNTDKMARRLQRDGIVPEGRLDWTKKVKTVGNEFVEHTVETSELMVTFETTLREYPGFELRETEHLFADLPDRTQTEMMPWYIKGKPDGFPAKARYRVVPDAVFSVRGQVNGELQERFFVAEIDTTAMSVVRAMMLENKLKRALLDLRDAKSDTEKRNAKQAVDNARHKLLLHNIKMDQTSFLQKFVKYFWAWKQGWHKKHFGWPSIQHLVTTRTTSHRDRLIEGLQYVAGGNAPNLFLFSTFEEIRDCSDIMQHEWFNGAGERVSLMKQ